MRWWKRFQQQKQGNGIFLPSPQICGDENDFNNKSKEMASFFLHRNYPPTVVVEPSNASVPSPERQQHDHLTMQTLTRKSSPWFSPTNSRVKNILSNLNQRPRKTSVTWETWVCTAATLIQKTPWSTGDDSNGTFPCCRQRCKTCAYTNSAAQINTPGGRLTIRQKFASSPVYIITCPTCTLCYIGETGRRLGDRFCEHLRSVKKKADLPVPKHFSSPGQRTDDMMVSVVRTGFKNTTERRSAEERLIFKCQTL